VMAKLHHQDALDGRKVDGVGDQGDRGVDAARSVGLGLG
jgi:hypothetical protein